MNMAFSRTICGLFLVCLCCLALTFLSGCENNTKVSPVDMMVEMPIKEGPFTVNFIENDINVTFSVVIYVVVPKKESLQFNRVYEQRKQRIIDRVTTVLRASTFEERMEAGMPAIKEKVKRAINEEIGTPWVTEVLFTDVSVQVS